MQDNEALACMYLKPGKVIGVSDADGQTEAIRRDWSMIRAASK